MSISLMGKIFRIENVLSSPEKFVLLSLADHGNDDGLSIYPSIALTAQRTSLTERSVQRIQKTLVDKGLLKITTSIGGHIPNHYQINVELIDNILSGQQILPLTQCHPCLEEEEADLALTESHPCPDRESPLPRQRVTRIFN